MYDNVPDDWNNYWFKCPDCGSRCHASEGSCDFCDIRDEDYEDEGEDTPVVSKPRPYTQEAYYGAYDEDDVPF